MPGGKLRLKGLFTGGKQVGATGNYITEILAGSVVFECGSMAASIASNVCAVVSISGLTASHILAARVLTGNACTMLQRSVAGVDQASFFFAIPSKGHEKASQTTTIVQYVGFKVA